MSMHYHALIVKVLALIGAVHVAGGAIAVCDSEHDKGLFSPLVGAIRGVGDVIIGTGNGVAYIIGRLIPPKNPQINTASILNGVTVVLSGPALLGVLFASVYEDARRKGELGGERGFSIDY
jgi:hypothetical protein